MAHVLIADDSEDIRGVLKMIVEGNGHRVSEAENGRDALYQLGAADPPVDLVVTDLDMPVMDGAFFVLRCREAYPSLPVIVLTASPGGETRAPGTQAYLKKSFDSPRQLPRMIDKLLRLESPKAPPWHKTTVIRLPCPEASDLIRLLREARVCATYGGQFTGEASVNPEETVVYVHTATEEQGLILKGYAFAVEEQMHQKRCRS